MAHRSYLYATDVLPSVDNLGSTRKVVGLSECRYNIPTLYGALLCGSPRLCLSNLWTFRTEEHGPPHPIALATLYVDGLTNLHALRRQVSQPAALKVLDEVGHFLERPENRLEFLLLEVAEYLWLIEEDEPPEGKLPQKVAALHAHYSGDAQEALEAVALKLNAIAFDGSEEGMKAATAEVHAYLGYCDWSNHLYYSF